LSREELTAISNALNAVCHAVRVAETDFPFLIGVTREEGRALLRRVSAALDDVSHGPPAGEAQEQPAADE
jgi:hypothetical protein